MLLTLSILLFCPPYYLSHDPVHISDTHSDCSTTAVGAGNQASLCGCHGNLELFPIQMQRSSHTYWYRHVANHILTAGAHHLENRNNRNL